MTTTHRLAPPLVGSVSPPLPQAEQQASWSHEAFALQPSIDAMQSLLRDLDGACWRVQRLLDDLREGRDLWPERASYTVRRAWMAHAELRKFVLMRQLSERMRGL